MSNTLGIIEEEMQARHNQYHRENPDQWAREDSTFTIQELAFGVSQNPSRVRAVLRRAGRRAPEAVRELLLAKSSVRTQHALTYAAIIAAQMFPPRNVMHSNS